MKGAKLKHRTEHATKNHRMRPSVHKKIFALSNALHIPVQHVIEIAVLDFLIKCENNESYKSGIAERVYIGEKIK